MGEGVRSGGTLSVVRVRMNCGNTEREGVYVGVGGEERNSGTKGYLNLATCPTSIACTCVHVLYLSL